MMKRFFVFSVAVTMIVTGCGSEGSESQNSANEQEESVGDMDAEAVAASMKDAGAPLEVIKVYDEESDPNEMLGRPNGYTSKLVFADDRLENTGERPGVEDGGGVEVFDSSERAESRSEEIQDKLESAGLGTEYHYTNEGVLVRVAGELTPDQATDYEEVVGEL